MKKIKIIALGILLLASCANGDVQQDSESRAAILPNTLTQTLLRDSEIIKECKHEAVLADFSELTCVEIRFPANTGDRDAKEVFAANLTSEYAKSIADKGWTLTTDWKLMKVFEKPVSEDCSAKVKIMAWLVDETKPVAERNFETSRLSFLRDKAELCGDKRKAKP